MPLNQPVPVLIDTIRAVVAEKGEDYVYPYASTDRTSNCRYSEEDGTPSCIVGHVIQRLDPELFDHIKVFEDGGISLTRRRSFAIAQIKDYFPGVEITGENRNILRGIQHLQDGGATWGAATSELGRYL